MALFLNARKFGNLVRALVVFFFSAYRLAASDLFEGAVLVITSQVWCLQCFLNLVLKLYYWNGLPILTSLTRAIYEKLV